MSSDRSSAPLRPGDPAPPFTAQPVFGPRIAVPDDLARAPLVIFFVRYLGCPFCRESLARLQERVADFERAGASLVAVSRSRVATARDHVPRHHLLFPLVADPDGDLFDRYGVGLDRALGGTISSLARPGALAGAARAFRWGHGRFEGPERQLGAAFVLDRAGRVALAGYATSVVESPDLDALLACVSSL